MDLIPVIDLLQGQVVRGIAGNRKAYRPIESLLCRSSDPLVVARCLCEYAAADTLYIADLDALQAGAPQLGVLLRLLEELPPSITLWLDAGFADAATAQRLFDTLGPQAGRVWPVFASESLSSAEALEACVSDPQKPALLSLDRRDGQRMDPAGCWDRPALWPERVIVMTLERVGSGGGPDLQTLAKVAETAAATGITPRLIGAGGIASEDDLRHAQAAGASAWLVASALHDLRLERKRPV